MYIERWVALGLALLNVVLGVIGGLQDAEPGWIEIPLSAVLVSVFGLGLIWWGDDLGEGMTGSMYGLGLRPSPGWMVKGAGFLFLLAPLILALVYCLVERGS